MAKFIKLKLNGIPGVGTDIQWRMVIDNIDDLKEYHSLNGTLNMEALMSMERDVNGNIMISHIGAAPTRHIALQRVLHCKINAAKEGEKIFPIVEVAKITDEKYLNMLKFLNNHGSIQMNEAGGYCGLDAFIKTWDAEILEEIEKKSLGFPVTDAAIKADTLILENSNVEYSGGYLETKVKHDIKNHGDIQTIYNLREIDTEYLIKCISLSKNIVIKTQLVDDNQFSLFMKMFKTIPGKNIYLYVLKEVENKIRTHEDFYNNSLIHNISFIN